MFEEFGQAARWHRPLAVFAGAMAITGVGCGIGYAVDPRLLDGVSVWAKPLKFSVSFAVYAGTLAWLTSRLDDSRGARLARRAGTVIAVAAAGEMLAVLLQAARGRRSHFNVSTPVDAAVYAAMGGLAVVIFVATIAVAVALLRQSPSGDPALRWALRFGVAISLAGMAVGFLMVTPRSGQGPGSAAIGGHNVGSVGAGHVLPVLGWDTSGGDLRVPHFVGMHALQVLPLLAAGLALLPGLRRQDEQTRLRLLQVASGGYAGAFGLVLWQALRGQSVTSPDRWTATAAATLVGGVAAAVVAVLARHRRAEVSPR